MKRKIKKRCERKLISKELVVLKHLRLENNLTQSEVGKLLGISGKGVEAFENGRVNVSGQRLEVLLNCYGVSQVEFENLIANNTKSFNNKKNKRPKLVNENCQRRSYKKIVTKECLAIKALRKFKEISQDEASMLCGYPRSTFGHIENGRIELTEQRIAEITKSLGLKNEDFTKLVGLSQQRFEKIESLIKTMNRVSDDGLDVVLKIAQSLK